MLELFTELKYHWLKCKFLGKCSDHLMGVVLPKSKYNKLIRSLADEELYTASTIADLAVDFYKVRRNGKERTSIRKAVYGRTKRYQFPIEGDDQLKAIGHAAIPAWYGRRWKQSLDEKALNKILKKEAGFGRKWFWKTLILGFPILVLAGVSVVGPSRLREGYELLRIKGPMAAYQFFANSQGEENQVGKGWTALRTQNFEEARRLANRILVRDDKYKGHALYLLAYVEFYDGNLRMADYFFRETISYYEGRSEPKAIYLTLLGLARTAIEEYCLEENNLALAEQYLENALKFGEPTPEFFGLKSRIRFEKGDYEAAIEWAIKKRDLFYDNLPIRAQVFVDLAFYSIISGDLTNGFDYYRKANALATEIQDKGLLQYNHINEMIIAKCLDMDAALIQEEIETYFESVEDPTLKRFVDFSKTFECP